MTDTQLKTWSDRATQIRIIVMAVVSVVGFAIFASGVWSRLSSKVDALEETIGTVQDAQAKAVTNNQEILKEIQDVNEKFPAIDERFDSLQKQQSTSQRLLEQIITILTR